MTPTPVYLHGIGAEHDDPWCEVSAVLVEAGYPGVFDGVDCWAPKYPNTLRYTWGLLRSPESLPIHCYYPISVAAVGTCAPVSAMPAWDLPRDLRVAMGPRAVLWSGGLSVRRSI